MKSNNKELIIGAAIIGLIVMAVIAVVVILLTTDEPLTGEVTKSITLDQLNISEEIIKGEEKYAALTAITENITESLVWTSSDSNIAVVEGAGDTAVVTLKSAGTAVIIVTAGDVKAECHVSVKEVEASISLTPNDMTEGLVKGETKVITISATLANLTGNIEWSVDNKDVATIVGNGETAELTLKSVGEVIVTAKVGDKVATCKVKVNDVTSMITLNTTSITENLKKGATVSKTLEAKLLNVTGALEWTSSNPKVASVSRIDDTKAKVTVIGEGTATITVTDGTVKATCTVKATQVKPSISLNKTSIKKNLVIGDTETISGALVATIKNGSGTIEWESSNEKVAVVSGNGNKANIIILKSGTSTITAKCKIDGVTYKAICTVAVTYIQPTLTLNKTTITDGVLAGGTKTLTDALTATLKDAKGTITWESDNENIVSLSAKTGTKATLTLKAAGTTKVRAKYSAEGILCVAECTVTVTESKPDITLNKTSLSTEILFGSTQVLSDKLVATLKNVPAGTEVKWTTSNPVVATCEGGVVTAKGEGTATIKATIIVNGIEYSKTCNVTVKYKTPTITLNKQNLSKEILFGSTQVLSDKLVATVTNAPAGTEVKWTTSNSVVATCDSGVVTVKAEGTAVITASITVNGKTYSAICTVAVKYKTPSITLNKSELSVIVVLGGTRTLPNELQATVTNVPAGTEVKWTTSNSDVVTVSGGSVTAKKSGEAIITASITVNGVNKSATCKVKVSVVEPIIIISPSVTTIEIGRGTTKTVQLTKIKENVTGATIGDTTWTSSKPAVASVDASGKVTAKSAGTTTITVKVVVNNIEYTATCSVTVKYKTPVLTLSKETLNVNLEYIIGNATSGYMTERIERAIKASVANVVPEPTITWTSSDTDIVEVINRGKEIDILAYEAGKAVITASCEVDGVIYEKDCIVTVGKSKEIKASINNITIKMYENSNFTGSYISSNGKGTTLSGKVDDHSTSAWLEAEVPNVPDGFKIIWEVSAPTGQFSGEKVNIISTTSNKVRFKITGGATYTVRAICVYERAHWEMDVATIYAKITEKY